MVGVLVGARVRVYVSVGGGVGTLVEVGGTGVAVVQPANKNMASVIKNRHSQIDFFMITTFVGHA